MNTYVWAPGDTKSDLNHLMIDLKKQKQPNFIKLANL